MQLKKICIIFLALFSAYSHLCFAQDALPKKDLQIARTLAANIMQWSIDGKIDKLWSVSSTEKINELLKAYGSEVKAKEVLTKRCASLKGYHWKIVKENYMKSNNSIMFTLDVFKNKNGDNPRKIQLCFIKESGIWKWRY